MYSIGKCYKFELKGKIFYTGTIESEDITSIKIATIRNEEIIVNKESIVQAKKTELKKEKE